MSVPRGTTPTFTLTFTEDGLDLTMSENVYVTFSQGNKALTKTGSDLTVAEKTIAVYLTQKETLLFNVGTVEVQANWTDASGGRTASEITEYDWSKQLLSKVVE